MDNLFKQLKQLNEITPDKDFSDRCRREILAVPSTNSANSFYYSQIKQRVIDGVAFTLAVGLTALLIYFSFLSFGFASDNKGQVAKKESAPDFNISLEKAKYFKEVAPDVYIVVLGEE